jgi:hypothetical protein
VEIVIAGGGIAGLIAAETFITLGMKPTIIDGGRLGGQWARLTALKYLHADRVHDRYALLSLIHRVGITEYEEMDVNGGVLIALQGGATVVAPHPEVLGVSSIGPAIADAHWVKTRGDGERRDSRAMNRGSQDVEWKRKRIDLGGTSLLDALVERVRSGARVAENSQIQAIDKRSVELVDGSIPYDLLITTLPLWSFTQLFGDKDFRCQARKLTVRTYYAPSFTVKYRHWDYLYTPWTPHGRVHRLSPAGRDMWAVEANRPEGDRHASSDHHADAMALLGNAAQYVSEVTTTGHLLPLSKPYEYPRNVKPLGRFAQWDARMTVDRVCRRAEVLASECR